MLFCEHRGVYCVPRVSSYRLRTWSAPPSLFPSKGGAAVTVADPSGVVGQANGRVMSFKWLVMDSLCLVLVVTGW